MAHSKSKRTLSSLILVLTIYGISLQTADSALARSSPFNSRSSGLSLDSSTSRFRGLDKVLNRLDESGVSPKTTTTFPDAKEFGDLDDDDYDSYEDEEDMGSVAGNNDVLSDKMSNWGSQYRNRYLASRTTPSTTTTTTTTTTPPPPPQLSYSQYKWQTYGTRQAVDQSRRQSYSSSSSNSGGYSPSNSRSSNSYHQQNQNNGGRHHSHHHHQGNNPYSSNHHNNQHGSYSSNSRAAGSSTPDTAIREAIAHAMKVSREGACKTPRPKVVQVQEYYPHPGKTYLPHCTILYQCADDTGCCKNDLTCSPKSTQRVELSFYTMTVDTNRGSTVERLVFYNHTECECRDKLDEMMPRDLPYSESLSNDLDPITSNSNNQGLPFEGGLRTKSLLKCKCPSTFTERTLSDGSCSCDCFDKQMDCLKQKRGRDFFSMQDKWCIQSGRCEIPGCSYGSYIHLAGRCPRKEEKFGHSLSWHKYLTN